MKKNIFQTVQARLPEQNDQASKALPATSAQIRIPTQRPVPHLNHHIQRETKQVTKEWTTEVSHTDTLSPQLTTAPKKSADLAPKRIQRLHIKKMSTLLRKMAELHETSRKKVSQKVSVVDESQKKLEHKQDELWRDMMKPHEERQYQIGRITNYFS